MVLGALFNKLNRDTIGAYEKRAGLIEEHYGIEQTVGCGGWGVFCLKVVLAVMLYVPMALMLLTDRFQRLRWWAMLRSSGRWGETGTLREQGSV